MVVRMAEGWCHFEGLSVVFELSLLVFQIVFT